MRSVKHAEMLRDVGLVPTIQRLAVLDWLTKTRIHPTADQVLAAIRKEYPSISRATVYNTLDALTKAGMVLRLSVDPTVARYDADLGPHAHFRCRICERIYDIPLNGDGPLDGSVDGHVIESVRTYAYGVCASCQAKTEGASAQSPNDRKQSERTKALKTTSSPDPSDRREEG
jgi:Fe2+ or Zn2+ uptake regulation protein